MSDTNIVNSLFNEILIRQNKLSQLQTEFNLINQEINNRLEIIKVSLNTDSDIDSNNSIKTHNVGVIDIMNEIFDLDNGIITKWFSSNVINKGRGLLEKDTIYNNDVFTYPPLITVAWPSGIYTNSISKENQLHIQLPEEEITISIDGLPDVKRYRINLKSGNTEIKTFNSDKYIESLELLVDDQNTIDRLLALPKQLIKLLNSLTSKYFDNDML